MARLYKDRVAESLNAAPGTGNFVLNGALPGYQTFAGVSSVGDTFDYAAFAVDGNGVPNGAWETGTGTFATGDQISRAAQESSNGNALVNFGSASVIVVMTENAQSIAALAAGGGGGGGGGATVLGKNITDQTGWGGDTSQNGVPIPGTSYTFTAPADGLYVVRYFIRYNNHHRVRFNLLMDGARWQPHTPGNGHFDYFAYMQPEENIGVIDAVAMGFLAAGSHTVSTLYNAMDNADFGTTDPVSFVSITPVNIAGGGGGGGSSTPWYWKPPAGGMLTPYSQNGNNNPTITADADIGTVIDFGTLGDSQRRGALYPVSNVKNWTMDLHFKYTTTYNGYSAPIIGPVGWTGAPTSRGAFAWFWNQDQCARCRAWVEQLDGGNTSAQGSMNQMVYANDCWIRVVKSGDTDYEFFMSRDGKHWFTVYHYTGDNFNGVIPNQFYFGIRVDGGENQANSHCVLVIDSLTYTEAA